VDEDGRFEYINPAFTAICGWNREEILGKGFMRMFPPDRQAVVLERWNEVLHGIGGQYETEVLTGSGALRTLIMSQWRMIVGDVLKVVVTAKDITAERLAEKEQEKLRSQLEDKVRQRTAALVEINARLSRSEAALARAQTTARIGSWEWDLVSERPEWSNEMFLLHGLPPAPVAPPIADIVAAIYPADRDYVMDLMWTAIRTGRSYRSEHRIMQRDGKVIDVVAIADVITDASGKSRRIVGTFQDITERRCLEREIVEAGRHEQQRIGRDIHDSLGQELAGLAMMAKALENQIRKTDPKLVPRASEISKLAGVAAARARDIAHGLSPVDIDAEAFSSELQRMTERVRDLYGIACAFSVIGDDRVYDNAVATHLFHIVQEAVTNAIKHASPSVITVELRSGEEGVVTVVDDGSGIHLPTDGNCQGIGLRIMRHRADIIGARLAVVPLPGGGTRVACTFPNRAPRDLLSP
jgi:PAS domain S-box-containing protein